MSYSYACETVNAFQYAVAFVSTSEIETYVNIACAIITSIVLCTIRIISWYKESKKDGKITKEEINDLVDIVKDTKKDIDKIKK